MSTKTLRKKCETLEENKITYRCYKVFELLQRIFRIAHIISAFIIGDNGSKSTKK